MCIIIVKPAGKALPEKQYLRVAYEHNNQGAGIATLNDDGKVFIKKDFLNFTEYYDYICKIPIDKPIILHNRIATSGNSDVGGRHPFPVSNDIKQLRAAEIVTNMALAHNGVFSKFAAGDGILSDTQVFIRDIMVPLKEKIGNEGVLHLLEAYMNKEFCKIAILQENSEEIQMFGSYSEFNGCFFSNTTYKPYASTYYKKDYYRSSYNKCVQCGVWSYCNDDEVCYACEIKNKKSARNSSLSVIGKDSKFKEWTKSKKERLEEKSEEFKKLFDISVGSYTTECEICGIRKECYLLQDEFLWLCPECAAAEKVIN